MNNMAACIVVVLIALIAACGIFYEYDFVPYQEKRDELTSKIEEHKSDLSKFDQVKKNIKKLEEKIKDLEAQKAKLQTDSIPLNTVVPKMLDSTETIANKFNVKFSDIRISPLVRAEDWAELPVEMTILGTFNNVGCFLNVMEQRKIVNLAAGSMNVSVSAEVDKDTKSPMLSVTLSAKIYIL